MRIVLVGTPNSQKRKLAFDLQKQFPHLRITRPPSDGLDGAAVGALADPRADLFLLAERTKLALTDDYIYTHSLLDTLAHVAARIVIREGDDMDILPWELLGALTGWIIPTSFKADFVIQVLDDELGYYEGCLEEALDAILTDLRIIPNLKLVVDDGYDIETIAAKIRSEMKHDEHRDTEELTS